MRVLGAQEMRQAFLRDQEGAARVDAMDQVVALHGRAEDRAQPHRARIIEADVDATEPSNGRGYRRLDLLLVADVTDEWQRSSAGVFDLPRSGVDRPWQRGMWLRGLGRDRDIGAVAGRAQHNSEPDSARTAADKDRLASQ